MHMPAEIKQAIDAAHGGPIQLSDGEQQYVILRAEVYDRLKELLDLDALTETERLGLLREAGQRAGWDDPDMDIYNDLAPRIDQ